MSRIVAPSFLALALAAVPAFCISAPAGGAWSYKVMPGLGKAGPAVVASTKGTAADLVTTVTDLANTTTGVLSTSTYKSTTSLRLRLPQVQEDTFVEVGISTATASATGEAFRWRTLARPAGKSLMNYQGKKEMMPPPDFEKYWARAKKELAAVPATPRVTRVPDKDSTSGLLFQVELDSVQDTSIVGWLFVPRAAFKNGDVETSPTKKFPGVMIAPGYNGDQRPVDRTARGYVTFAVNPRNHGPSRAFWKSPVEHLIYNITDCENYYYKLAYLDCLRAAQFLLERPEVDSKRIGTEGSSQGALFALATAALEPRIACVAANVIAFSAIPDGTVLGIRGGMTTFAGLLDECNTTATLVRRTLTYIDGANMATLVKCPVQINMGALDTVSPYVCGIVVHNRLPKQAKRDFHLAPDAGHEVTKAMRDWNAAWQKKWLEQ